MKAEIVEYLIEVLMELDGSGIVIVDQDLTRETLERLDFSPELKISEESGT